MPRKNSTLILTALICALCCGLGSTVVAQQRKARDKVAVKPRRPRPRQQPVFRMQKLSPQMEQFLIDWENKTELIKKLSAKVRTEETNTTFGVKKLGTGEVKFVTPDKASYHIKPVEITEEMKAAAKKKGDITLDSADEERFVSTGKEIYRINDREKTYEKIPIPPNMQGKRIIDGPLPFLFGMKAEEAKRRYKFYPLKPSAKIPDSVWLIVIPRRQADLQNYKQAMVILNKRTFVPIAVKTTDLAGTTSKVYMFGDKNNKIKINPRKMIWQGAFIKPNVRGYKQIQAPKGAEEPGRVKVGGEDPRRKPPRNARDNPKPIRRTNYRRGDKPPARRRSRLVEPSRKE